MHYVKPQTFISRNGQKDENIDYNSFIKGASFFVGAHNQNPFLAS